MIKFVDESVMPARLFLNLVGSAESSSEHSLAKAVVKYCQRTLKRDTFVKCTNFTVVSGCGLKAKVTLGPVDGAINTADDSQQSLSFFKEFEDFSWFFRSSALDPNSGDVKLNNLANKTKSNESVQYDILIGN